MIYPDTIKIGGTEFNVVISKAKIFNPANGAQLNGATLMDQRMIAVWDNPYFASSTEETFVHECIEAAVDVYDLHFVDPSTGKRYSMPHSAIKTLGVALHQAFTEANLCFGEGSHLTQ